MSGSGARILILDDQRAARRVLRSVLASIDDLHFEEAATLDQALALCREQRFDAYLVDIHLSESPLERGGIEFIKQVPATWDEIRVLNGRPMENITVARRMSRRSSKTRKISRRMS